MGFNHSAQLSLLALGGSISGLMGAIGSVRAAEHSRAKEEATNKWRTEYARIQEQKAANDKQRLALREKYLNQQQEYIDIQKQKVESITEKRDADTKLKESKAKYYDAKTKALTEKTKASKDKHIKAKSDTNGETNIQMSDKVAKLQEVKQKEEKRQNMFNEPSAEFITVSDDKRKKFSESLSEGATYFRMLQADDELDWDKLPTEAKLFASSVFYLNDIQSQEVRDRRLALDDPTAKADYSKKKKEEISNWMHNKKVSDLNKLIKSAKQDINYTDEEITYIKNSVLTQDSKFRNEDGSVKKSNLVIPIMKKIGEKYKIWDEGEVKDE